MSRSNRSEISYELRQAFDQVYYYMGRCGKTHDEVRDKRRWLRDVEKTGEVTERTTEIQVKHLLGKTSTKTIRTSRVTNDDFDKMLRDKLPFRGYQDAIESVKDYIDSCDRENNRLNKSDDSSAGDTALPTVTEDDEFSPPPLPSSEVPSKGQEHWDEFIDRTDPSLNVPGRY